MVLGKLACGEWCMPVRAACTAISRRRPSTKRLLPMPLSPYAAAKVAGEYYCQAFTSTYGLETVTIRYFNVFGPRQDPKSQYAAVIPKFITEMLAGGRPTIFGDGKQSRDFTYIDNIVHGNLLAADAPDGGRQDDQRRVRRVVRFAAVGGWNQQGVGHERRSRFSSRHAPAMCATAWPTSAWRAKF